MFSDEVEFENVFDQTFGNIDGTSRNGEAGVSGRNATARGATARSAAARRDIAGRDTA